MASEPTGPMRRIAFGVTTVLFVLVFSLAVLEVGLRVYSRIKPNVDVEFYRYASLMKGADPGSGMGFRHTPGTRARLFGVEVEIDGRGFRDAEIEPPRAPGSLRIALLGDSITFGWGVAYGDRFSEILEREWSGAGSAVELINSGHGNWGTVQELAALRELFADDPLDGVIQVWYINDAEPPPPYRDPPWYGRFYVSIFFWSKLDLLQRRVGTRESYVDYYRDLYEDGAEGFPGFVDALDEIGRWTRERNLPWIFVILPEFHDFDREFEDVYDLVAERASAAGATVVDATPAFRGEDPATIWVAYNDVHPNAKGHAIIARAIRDAVDPAIFRSRRERSGES